MADKATTSKSAAKAEVSAADKIESLKDQLRTALIESGRDEATVDAQMYALRIPETNVVGNFADLQRMGAKVDAGTGGAQAIEEAVAEGTGAPASLEEQQGG